MTIALVGAHGTGKTTIFNLLKTAQPDWQFFGEGVRHLMTAYGYKDPYEMVSEIGAGAFQLMNVNAWSVIDPQANGQFDKNKTAVCDGAVISNFIYFHALRKTQTDMELGSAFIKVASYYASLIDYFIYFPINVIPLKADPMRPGDYDFQKRIDDQIPAAFIRLNIPAHKIHKLQADTAAGRVAEIIALIGR